MAKVVALQTWSNGTITMDEKSVQDIPDALASTLIAQGICADASSYFGGGSGGGVLVVHDTNGTLDKTWQEIHDAMLAGGAVVSYSETEVGSVNAMRYKDKDNTYAIEVNQSGGSIRNYIVSSADGYPILPL